MSSDLGLTEARYSAMRWNTPLSEEHAELLVDRLDVAKAASVLDLGCGWGELLIRVVEAAREDCAGVGVDIDDAQLEHARRAVAQRGLDERITFVRGEARKWVKPADRVVCLGAAHAWGGTASALTELAGVVAPDGRLLFGDGCWEADPTPVASAIFGEEVLRLPELLEHALKEGWRVLSVTTADQREWDEFESTLRLGQETWLHSHPDAPNAEALRQQLDDRLTEYVGGYRGILGFCYLVLAR